MSYVPKYTPNIHQTMFVSYRYAFFKQANQDHLKLPPGHEIIEQRKAKQNTQTRHFTSPFYIHKVWIEMKTDRNLHLQSRYFKLYFICRIHKYLQSNTVIIYISIIQTGFRRKSEDLFESVSLICSIAEMF